MAGHNILGIGAALKTFEPTMGIAHNLIPCYQRLSVQVLVLE
jgi:hypothetical protein